MDIYELAEEASGFFTERDSPSGRIAVLTDSTPQWVRDLARVAHADMPPDNWRYEAIFNALTHIAEVRPDDIDDAHEFADGFVSPYTSDRLAWLASHLERPGYVDEARADGLIAEDTGEVERIGIGMYAEACEVYGLVLRGLRDQEQRMEEV